MMAAGTLLLPSCAFAKTKEQHFGVQLYSFRDAMAKDALGTLKQIASIGIKEIESARSQKGHYYGLTPEDMKKACEDLGMSLKSGHVALDDHFQKTMEEAVASGQPYLICSSMPSKGQTVDNYKKVAEAFNKAGEDCKELGLKFGYHNHEYEFESYTMCLWITPIPISFIWNSIWDGSSLGEKTRSIILKSIQAVFHFGT